VEGGDGEGIGDGKGGLTADAKTAGVVVAVPLARRSVGTEEVLDLLRGQAVAVVTDGQVRLQLGWKGDADGTGGCARLDMSVASVDRILPKDGGDRIGVGIPQQPDHMGQVAGINAEPDLRLDAGSGGVAAFFGDDHRVGTGDARKVG